MRLFIGTPVAATHALKSILKDLTSSGADLKVVAPENLHVTYKFLGETGPGRAPLIVDALRSAALPPAFEVPVEGTGAFPNWKKPSVLWAGINDEDGMLGQVMRAVEETMAGLGWPRETRPFKGHLTLARRRSPRGLQAAKQVMEAARDKRFGTMHVDEIILYKSALTPEGPVYEKAGRIQL
jgi:2'-5' RNA ligase